MLTTIGKYRLTGFLLGKEYDFKSIFACAYLIDKGHIDGVTNAVNIDSHLASIGGYHNKEIHVMSTKLKESMDIPDDTETIIKLTFKIPDDMINNLNNKCFIIVDNNCDIISSSKCINYMLYANKVIQYIISDLKYGELKHTLNPAVDNTYYKTIELDRLCDALMESFSSNTHDKVIKEGFKKVLHNVFVNTGRCLTIDEVDSIVNDVRVGCGNPESLEQTVKNVLQQRFSIIK